MVARAPNPPHRCRPATDAQCWKQWTVSLTLTGDPARDCPFANSGPERLGAIPVDPGFVALLAVAHEATADEVLAHGQAAVHLGDDMIEGRAAAERIAAVGTLVVPGEVDLIARGAACDQAGLVNVVLIH